MATVLIIGAGGVSRVVTKKCAMNSNVFSKIVLASRTKSKCDQIAAEIKESLHVNIETAAIDADDIDALVVLIESVKPALVLNIALPYQDLTIMDACVKTKVPYLDTANYEHPDLAKFEYKEQWARDNAFKDAGIMALLGSGFDPFLAASGYAVLNTVSENYAVELQHSPEDSRTGWLGHTLRARGIAIAGITNGIDPKSFEPSEPQTLHLPHGFNIRSRELEGKRACKTAMLAQLSHVKVWKQVRQYGVLSGSPDMPLFTFVGRLTSQKGVDIVLESLLRLLQQEENLHMLLFGSGAAELERQLELLAESEQGWGKICFLKGYDPALANQVYAAGDFFLIPSRYEPCGLTDYIAQLLGNLPIVHRVGGLVKVIDGETGFSYTGNSAGALAELLRRGSAGARRSRRSGG